MATIVISGNIYIVRYMHKTSAFWPVYIANIMRGTFYIPFPNTLWPLIDGHRLYNIKLHKSFKCRFNLSTNLYFVCFHRYAFTH